MMPPNGFGESAIGYLRINPDVPDTEIDEAAMRSARYTQRLGLHRAVCGMSRPIESPSINGTRRSKVIVRV
ncbi:hypothetical protein [Bradyrhizobium sp. STM 3566]|uniref:hypothetical protein n=1 Tax=Bradyrhizobium sp. STM 3566 TaxID=578928 RepID=UPI003890FAD4